MRQATHFPNRECELDGLCDGQDAKKTHIHGNCRCAEREEGRPRKKALPPPLSERVDRPPLPAAIQAEDAMSREGRSRRLMDQTAMGTQWPLGGRQTPIIVPVPRRADPDGASAGPARLKSGIVRVLAGGQSCGSGDEIPGLLLPIVPKSTEPIHGTSRRGQ